MIKKLFLETNALYTLGAKLENVDFETLQGFREFSNFELLVAETSWKEYLRHRKKELSDCLSNVQLAARRHVAMTNHMLQMHRTLPCQQREAMAHTSLA